MLYLNLGNYEAAIEDANQVLAINPFIELAYRVRGDAYYELGEYELALADYEMYEELAGSLEPSMQEVMDECGENELYCSLVIALPGSVTGKTSMNRHVRLGLKTQGYSKSEVH